MSVVDKAPVVPGRAARICCLDLDTFFVSVERLLDPSLEGRPVVVGGRPGQRGVVTAASYEVREQGVRSGMSLTEAARLAPHAIFLPTRHDVYGHHAASVRALAEEACPVVQMASIDEMYLDLRGCERLYRRPTDVDDDATIERVVRELTARIARETGLPASVGIASSKPVAKVASGLAKPRGVLLVRTGSEAALLGPLPVRKYPGIGPVAERRLAELGLFTLADVAAAPRADLERVFGAYAARIASGAAGQPASAPTAPPSGKVGSRDRPAFVEHDPEHEVVGSISNERTFRADVSDRRTVDAMLCGLCERVCYRARKRAVQARTVTLKLRFADFHTISRSESFAPTSSELEIYPVIKRLSEAAIATVAAGHPARRRIRLLGVALSNLGVGSEQLELFQGHERLHRAVDGVRARYGFDALRLARSSRSERHDKGRGSSFFG